MAVKANYETVLVLSLKNGEEAAQALLEKFTKRIEKYATLQSVDEWGKRRLAYPINDKNDGYYVLVNFKSEGSFTAELERLFGINESILRSIVIRQIEDKKTRKDA